MVVITIIYSNKFRKELRVLPDDIIELALRKEELFRDNPLHPSLRLHQLQGKLLGLYSLSLSGNYRIIFERQKNGDIFFVSIGSHDIYKYL